MKEEIVTGLAQFGWHKDRIVDAFIKVFETGVVPNQASIWLRRDLEHPRWLITDGNFVSASENVLAGTSLFLDDEMSDAEVAQAIADIVAELERKIAGAWSVRLLAGLKLRILVPRLNAERPSVFDRTLRG